MIVQHMQTTNQMQLSNCKTEGKDMRLEGAPTQGKLLQITEQEKG